MRQYILTMIYGHANYPVEIRKIRLKIWKLRDELEFIIQERLAQADHDSSQIDTSDLKRPAPTHSTLSQDQHHHNLAQTLTQEENILLMQRARPQLEPSKMANGVVALMDLNAKNISCFSTQKYLTGQTVVVEFLIPRHLFITGEVLACHPYNQDSKIISQTCLDFRLHVRWSYRLPGEQTLLKRFLHSVRPSTPQEMANQDSEQT